MGLRLLHGQGAFPPWRCERIVHQERHGGTESFSRTDSNPWCGPNQTRSGHRCASRPQRKPPVVPALPLR